MGGRFGYGPLNLDNVKLKGHENKSNVFDKPWHAKVWAFAHLTGALGIWNLDVSRRFRESLPINDYVNFSYYEKWLAALTNILVFYKLVTEAELKKVVEETINKERSGLKTDEPKNKKCMGNPNWDAPDRIAVMKTLGWGGGSERESELKPKFLNGEKVETIFGNPNPDVKGGHTRLPGYAMGREGIIYAYRGVHVFPDKNAHGFGEEPQPLYTVEFSSRDLFGKDAEAYHKVFLDCWEPYLRRSR